MEERKKIANMALSDLSEWCYNWHTSKSSSEVVAIFDAANTTEARRKEIQTYLTATLPTAKVNKAFIQMYQTAPVQTIFIETIITDEELTNCHLKECEMTSPDASESESENFTRRVEFYKKTYASLSPENSPNQSFISLTELGKKGITFWKLGSGGTTTSRGIAFYLMNCFLRPGNLYSIYLTTSVDAALIMQKTLRNPSKV